MQQQQPQTGPRGAGSGFTPSSGHQRATTAAESLGEPNFAHELKRPPSEHHGASNGSLGQYLQVQTRNTSGSKSRRDDDNLSDDSAPALASLSTSSAGSSMPSPQLWKTAKKKQSPYREPDSLGAGWNHPPSTREYPPAAHRDHSYDPYGRGGHDQEGYHLEERYARGGYERGPGGRGCDDYERGYDRGLDGYERRGYDRGGYERGRDDEYGGRYQDDRFHPDRYCGERWHQGEQRGYPGRIGDYYHGEWDDRGRRPYPNEHDFGGRRHDRYYQDPRYASANGHQDDYGRPRYAEEDDPRARYLEDDGRRMQDWRHGSSRHLHGEDRRPGEDRRNQEGRACAQGPPSRGYPSPLDNSKFGDPCALSSAMSSSRARPGAHHMKPPSRREEEPVMVEIAPGVRVALRRTKDTVDAISNDFYLPVTCFGCSLDMFGIANVLYVVCPDCTVVSPLEGGEDNGGEGVGLGFTLDTLMQVQRDILMERHQRGQQEPQRPRYDHKR